MLNMQEAIVLKGRLSAQVSTSEGLWFRPLQFSIARFFPLCVFHPFYMFVRARSGKRAKKQVYKAEGDISATDYKLGKQPIGPR